MEMQLFIHRKGIEVRIYISQEKNIYFNPTSIDIIPNLKFIVIGFSNDDISLWDGLKPQLIYTIKNIQKSKILAVQF